MLAGHCDNHILKYFAQWTSQYANNWSVVNNAKYITNTFIDRQQIVQKNRGARNINNNIGIRSWGEAAYTLLVISVDPTDLYFQYPGTHLNIY